MLLLFLIIGLILILMYRIANSIPVSEVDYERLEAEEKERQNERDYGKWRD